MMPFITLYLLDLAGMDRRTSYNPWSHILFLHGLFLLSLIVINAKLPLLTGICSRNIR